MEQHRSKIEELLSNINDREKREECFTLLELMKEITDEKPKIWRGNMVGFGTYRYKYDSGREGEWFLTGFCPRKNNLVVYIVAGFKEYDTLLSKLGTYKTGSSCLYLNSLGDVDIEVLKELVQNSVALMRIKYNIKTQS